MNAEDELISKLKKEIGKTLPAMFAGMAESMAKRKQRPSKAGN